MKVELFMCLFACCGWNSMSCSLDLDMIMLTHADCVRKDAADESSIPAIKIKDVVTRLEEELDIKLLRLQALSPQHNKNACCWEMVFCDTNGRTLILQVAPSGLVYGDKIHREIWPADIQIGFIEDYSNRLEIPWDAIVSFELQQNSRITYLGWDGNRWMCLLPNKRGRFYLNETNTGTQFMQDDSIQRL